MVSYVCVCRFLLSYDDDDDDDGFDVPGVRRRWPEASPAAVIDTQVSPVPVAARVSAAVAVAAAYARAGARGLELAPRRRRVAAAAAAAIVALEERAARVALVERRVGKSAGGGGGFASRQYRWKSKSTGHFGGEDSDGREWRKRAATSTIITQLPVVGRSRSDPALA